MFMAIYHCSIKNIGRSSGRSAVASSAYRSGEKLEDKETGLTHDYTRKKGLSIQKSFSVKMLLKNMQTEQPSGTRFRELKRLLMHVWRENGN